MFVRTLVAAAAASLVVVLSAGAAPDPKVQDVFVTNTAADPAIVQVTGTPSVQVTGTPSVSIASSGNDVDVSSSPSSPVYTREAPLVFGDTMSMNASNGDVTCQAIDLATARMIRLEGVVVAISGGGAPRAWLEMWGELTPGGGAGVAAELDIPLRTNASQFFSHSGQLSPALPISGGTEFDNDGRPARVSGCIRAQASGSSTARFMFSGVYLD